MATHHQRVVIVGIDGLGGWYMAQQQRAGRLDALCPILSSLLSKPSHSGILVHCSSLAARTIFPPVSAPGWTAVLCGQTPDQTGITENRWPEGVVGLDPSEANGRTDFLAQRPLDDQASSSPLPSPPQSLFTQVPISGSRKHLSVVSWGWIGKLSDYIPHLCETIRTDGDDEAATQVFCSRWVRDQTGALPNLSFLHLDVVDVTGHKHGWESDEYVHSWVEMDARVATVLGHIKDVVQSSNDCLPQVGSSCGTLVVICSDHGGSGHSHGANDIRHMEVPILFASIGAHTTPPHTPPPLPLPPLSLLDIAPTVLGCLRIPPCPAHRGKDLLIARHVVSGGHKL